MGSKTTQIIGKNRRRRRDAFKPNKAGTLIFDESSTKDGTSNVPTRNDSVTLTHSGGSKVRLGAGGVGVASVGDVSIAAAGNAHITAKGTIQTTSEGSIRNYAQGDIVDVRGKQNETQMEAAKKMQEGVNSIEKAKANKIKSTKGDEVACPTCSKEYLVNRKSSFGSRAFKTIRKFTPPYFGFAIDILQWLYNNLVAPMLDIVSGQSLLGGSTCGNKGCKNGKVESPQKKLEAGNEEAVRVAEGISEEMNESAAKLKGGNVVDVSSGDRTIRAGLVMNDAPAYVDTNTYHNEEFRHEKDKQSGAYFAASGKGNAKRVVRTVPHHTVGNLNLEATNRLLLVAGSPGFGIETKGHGDLQFGSFTISAGEAEAVIASQNKTVIKGKNVIIDAEDRSGTEGIKLQSPHTRVAGALHVDGNMSMIGSLSIDGNLSAPFLKVPSMRLQTAKSSSTKTIANDAEWLGSAQTVTVADKALQVIMRDIMPGQQLDLDWIFTQAFEIFNLARISLSVEPVPTGFAFFFGCPPTCPPMLLPIWNWKHCHTGTPQSHTHDHTVPKGNYYDDRDAWGNARDDASSVPTPANDKGDGLTPGPKSNGGACGGGGFGFGSPNSNATTSTTTRNESFGITGSDAYGDYDFVNVTPVSGNFGYDEDGNITPIDKVNFSVSLQGCDIFDFDDSTDLSNSTNPNPNDPSKDGLNDC
jgi:hypothetical protein